LSATLYRNDGLVKVVHWYLGDVAYKEKMKSNNQVCVKILTYTSSDGKRFVDKTRQFKGKSLPDCTKMINNIVEIESRNKLIINCINKLREDPNRKILVLSGRKESHLHMLKKEVDDLIQLDVESGKILKEECKTYFYTGDTKQADRFEAEKNADILFATYEMAQEGLDIERLNTVILVTPKKDVVQAVGRVLRKVLQDGDVRPMIIDIVDNFSLFKTQAIVRENFYKKSDYVMNYYYIYDEKIISPKEFLELSGEVYGEYCNTKPKSLDEVLTAPPVEFVENTDSDSENNKTEKKHKRIDQDLLDMFDMEE
jgi:superfamily II DNA or RNA helicase